MEYGGIEDFIPGSEKTSMYLDVDGTPYHKATCVRLYFEGLGNGSASSDRLSRLKQTRNFTSAEEIGVDALQDVILVPAAQNHKKVAWLLSLESSKLLQRLVKL